MSLTRMITFRSLRSRPLRMLLSMFGIVLGVATVLAISVTNRTALDSITRLFEDTSGRSDLVITLADTDSDGFSMRTADQIIKYSELELVVPSVHGTTVLAEDIQEDEIGLSMFGFGMGGLLIYGIEPTIDPQVREYRVVDGQFLSEKQNRNEIVLVETFADEKEIEVGNTIKVVINNHIERLKVVGLMAKEGTGRLNNGSFAVIPLDISQKFFQRERKVDQIDIVVKPELSDSESIESIKTSIQETLGEEFSVIFPAAQGQRQTQMLGTYQIGLNFLSGMALFVGAFLIYNTFSMTVTERTREFGMLRTVGMTRAQVTGQVLSEAGVLGILGSLLGVGLGILIARGLTRLMEILLEQDLTTLEIPQEIVISSTFIGIAVAIISSIIPAFQAGRISPLEALRIRALSQDGWITRRGWILGTALLLFSIVVLIINPFPYDVQFRMGSLVVFSLFFGGTLMIPISINPWERLMRPVIQIFFGRSGRIGSSNIQRAKLRTTLTVGALMVGISMIVVVWAMTESFKGDLDAWLEGYVGGDVFVTSSVSMGQAVWRRIESVDAVAAATPIHYFEVEWRQDSGEKVDLTFMAFDPVSHSKVTSFLFSKTDIDEQSSLQQVASGNNIFVSSVIHEKYGLDIGDMVTLITRRGERDFRVAGIVVDYYNQGIVISGGWTDMERYFHIEDATAFLVKASPGYSPDQVGDQIDDKYGKRDRLVIASNENLLGRVTLLMQQAFSMFDVLALISMLVGFLGITNTLTVNVIERTQEIGMLRGVGMTREQIIQMVLAEAALMGMIGGILGVAFGVVLSRVFMAAMEAMSGYSLEFILPTERVIFAMLIAVVVSLTAALIPAIRAARIRILDAIHYE